MRARLAGFAALVLTLLAAGAGGAAESAQVPVPVVVLDGKGHGHGVGMAQDGAFWMAKGGATTPQILGHFYPGTALGKANGTPSVRVAVHTSPDATVVLSFPNGGEVRDGNGGQQAAGFPVRVPNGGRASVRFSNGRYEVNLEGGSAAPDRSSTASSRTAEPAVSGTAVAEPGPAQVPPASTTTTSTTPPAPPISTPGSTSTTSTSTTAPARPTTHESNGPATNRPVWAVPSTGGTVGVPARNRTYRGVIEATGASGPLRLVNQVDVDTYLRGMGEVRDPSWPPAALRSQAIAARTYALRAMGTSGELCDTQRCQVYLGSAAEYKAMDKAVADTTGQVVLHGKALASTVYSSNGGGFSASREEGFGTTGSGYPYLRAAAYTTSDPRPWHVEIALSDVAARLAYSGRLTAVSVLSVGASKRTTSVGLDGTAGPKTVTGLAFASALGLRSTMFDLRLGQSTTATTPPPVGDGSALQSLPEALNQGAATGLFMRVPVPRPETTTTTASAGRSAVASPTTPATSGGVLPGLALFLVATAAVATAATAAMAGPAVVASAVLSRLPGWARVRRPDEPSA